MTPFWTAAETLHAPVYFDREALARYKELGLKGFWMGYFASRSAAMGAASPELVTATFYGFAPARVRRALPDAWAYATPEQVLATRLDVARDALRPIADQDLGKVAGLLQGMLSGLDLSGRPLAAAHLSLAPPEDDLGRLWHAVTVLREYHGDCHLGVLLAAGVDGVTANVLAVLTGRAPAELQQLRGWDDDAWAHGLDQLRLRGWADEWGTLNDTGRAARDRLEEATDRVANAGLDDEARARMALATGPLTELARLVAGTGVLPYPNPVGAPRPE
ncbi:SCO6745 family protein [Aeromicrobium massiliense]|uniref:SCO6745 family protein n=1 Tax=Aeromicrobium massiliense TaxID=1464554 RepID=UPI0002FF4C7E|nr:hypothetical protein [Aeromicrobium massiliense]